MSDIHRWFFDSFSISDNASLVMTQYLCLICIVDFDSFSLSDNASLNTSIFPHKEGPNPTKIDTICEALCGMDGESELSSN